LRKWVRNGHVHDYRGKLGGKQAKIFVSVADVERHMAKIREGAKPQSVRVEG
jgi:hypothetical protein